MARQRVEETKFIDVQSMKGMKLLEFYRIKLDRTHRRHFLRWYGHFYTIDNTKVILTSTVTGFGIRQWFVCPVCSKRVKRLYLPKDEYDWACRCCHKLSYTSSQMSGRKVAI